MTGINSEARVWFYFAREQQVGPLTFSALCSSLQSGELSAHDYVFREGFQDWKKISDVPELLDFLKSPSELSTSQSGDRTVRLRDRRIQPRVALSDLVLAHNDAKITSGTVTDISATGLLLETPEHCFGLNDTLKLTIKDSRGLGKPLTLRATVVRLAHVSGSSAAYGLEFLELNDTTRNTIVSYVKRKQAS